MNIEIGNFEYLVTQSQELAKSKRLHREDIGTRDENFTGVSLMDLIERHEYFENVHVELIEEQQAISTSVSRGESADVDRKASTDMENLDFLQFKSRANAARQTSRTHTSQTLVDCMLGLNADAIEVIDALEAEMAVTIRKLESLEDRILSYQPRDFGEACNKLLFVSSQLINGHEIDRDQIAFIVLQCVATREDANWGAMLSN